MSKYDELRREKRLIDEEAQSISRELKRTEDEASRVSYIAGHAEDVLSDIDREFEDATQLTPEDVEFLFFAASLLTAKWLIMSSIAPLSLDYKPHSPDSDGRLSNDEGDKYAEGKYPGSIGTKKEDQRLEKLHKQQKELLAGEDISKSAAKRDTSDNGFRTAAQILFRPVPYDAISCYPGVQIPVELAGTNHRSHTLGHDPVFGWIFGPLNIIDRCITFRSATLDTFSVMEKGNIISDKTSFSSCIFESIESVQEDEKRLPAAVVRQALHFASDKYTKQGLPIPFVSAEKAQELIEKNWNTVEAKKWIGRMEQSLKSDSFIISIQFAISLLINEIIRILHIMTYEGNSVEERNLHEVRTRKILLTANCISSNSNIIYAAYKGYIAQNPAAGASALDIGGFIETAHRIASDRAFIQKIKKEFLENHWYETVMNQMEGETE